MLASSHQPQTRFDLLDGLRGVAAICVMLYHFGGVGGFLDGAWVSVDLFFALSGLVIHHNYANRIFHGLSIIEFLKIRLTRLWPLYSLGLSIGMADILLTPVHASIGTGEIATASVLGLFWIPYIQHNCWPSGDQCIPGGIFPLNDPAWSLFFELAVNLIFYIHLKRIGKMPSVKLFAICVGVYTLLTLRFGTFNQGHSATGFIWGLPRTIIGFYAGAILCESRPALMARMKSLLAQFHLTYIFGTVALTTLCLIAFSFGGGKSAFINSITLVPAAVFLLSWINISGRLKRLCKLLGEISYPLYILHFPLFRLSRIIFPAVPNGDLHANAITAIFCLLLSYLAIRPDEALRNWISKRVIRARIRIAAPAPHTAIR